MLRRSVLSSQVRTRISGLSDDVKVPRGQLTGVGKEDKMKHMMSLGCVLNKDLANWNGMGEGAGTFWKMVKAWWGMQEIKRRRDDLERDGLVELFKRYFVALEVKDLGVLKDLVSAYEYSQLEQKIKASKKKRSLKEITDKPTASVEVDTFTIICFETVDFQDVDYMQVNVRFAGTCTTTSTVSGTTTIPYDIYVVFEVAQPSHVSNNIFSPLRIAGTYTPEGDRIGEDTIDPSFYRAMQAQS